MMRPTTPRGLLMASSRRTSHGNREIQIKGPSARLEAERELSDLYLISITETISNQSPPLGARCRPASTAARDPVGCEQGALATYEAL